MIPTTIPEERTHHKYSMSKLNSYDSCPKYEGRKDSPTEAADEGTMLHEHCQRIVEHYVSHTKKFSFLENVEGYLTEDTGLTGEQKQCIRECLTEINTEINTANALETEEKLGIVYPDGAPLNFGFADVIFFFESLGGVKHATLVDFKFGRKLVPAPEKNLQGLGYALAILQKHTDLEWVNIKFIQPRVQSWPPFSVSRKDIPSVYGRISRVIQNAENPESKPTAGSHCTYCAKNGNCSAYLNMTSEIVKSYNNLPEIPTFHGSQITNPKHMAAAFYVVKQVEPIIESVKRAALVMAKNGEDLSFQNGDTEIRYELVERKASAELGLAPSVYAEVREVMPPELFIGCVDIRISDLEKYYAEARVEQAKAENEKMTKKAAIMELHEKLTNAGLLSRKPEGTVYLKQIMKPSNTESKTIDI